MKLIQLNAWNGRVEKPLIGFLEKAEADIYCLQEVIDLPGGEAGLFKSLDDMQAAAGLPYRYFSPVLSFNFMNRTAAYGNAILSRPALSRTETIFTHGTLQKDYDITKHGYNNRNLQHAVMTIKGTPIHVVNHHAYVVRGNKNDSKTSLAQMELVSQYIRKLEGPVILCGDFNLKPETESISKIGALLHNLSLEYALPTTSSPLSTRPETRDYIFVSDTIKVKAFYAADEIVSDHKALVLEFDI